MNDVAYIITGDGSITLILNKKTYSIDKEHINYDKIKNCLSTRNYDKLGSLLDISDTVTRKTNGKVSIKDGVVYYNGSALHNAITKRIIALIQQNFPFDFMVKFLENVMLNPSENSRNQLYNFLESNTLPITTDGCFLAYKRISSDFKDLYTGTIDNSIGNIVKMPRNSVDADPNETCSFGLHICSLAYLKHYGAGNPIVITKVNPKDVVSVPTDYKNTKMRVCEYQVLSKWDSDELEAFDGDALRDSDGTTYDSDSGCDCSCDCSCDCGCDGSECDMENNACYNAQEYGIKPDGTKYHNVRGKDGKFVKKNG